MSDSLRDQVHRLVDELSPQQLLTVRIFLDDLLAGVSSAGVRARASRRFELKTDAEQPSVAGGAKRISLDEYRRLMGIGPATE